MFGNEEKNVQDFLTESLFEAAPSDLNETLKFLQTEGVTLSQDQIEALTLLELLGDYDEIIGSIMKFRRMAMPTQQYRKVIETMSKAQAAANNPSMVGVLATEKGKK